MRTYNRGVHGTVVQAFVKFLSEGIPQDYLRAPMMESHYRMWGSEEDMSNNKMLPWKSRTRQGPHKGLAFMGHIFGCDEGEAKYTKLAQDPLKVPEFVATCDYVSALAALSYCYCPVGKSSSSYIL